MNNSEQMPIPNKFAQSLVWVFASEIFKLSLVLFFLLYIINGLFQGSVSRFINLDIFALVAIFTSIPTAFLMNNEENQNKIFISHRSIYLTAIIFSIAGSLIIYLKFKESGWLSLFATVGTFIFIFVITTMFLDNKIDKEITTDNN